MGPTLGLYIFTVGGLAFRNESNPPAGRIDRGGTTCYHVLVFHVDTMLEWGRRGPW